MARRKSRLWGARDTGILVDEDGFLVESDLLRQGSQLLPLRASTRAACTVLLGESGLGKSTEIGHLVEQLLEHVGPQRSLHLDLSTFQSDVGLTQALLDDANVRAWRAGADVFHLALDGLDQGQIVMPSLPGVLERLLGQLPTDRLCLYVASRPGEWPDSLEGFLRGRFDEHLAVLELAPLSPSDVREWATEDGLDGDRFLDDVRERRAGVFAARPITLGMLVRLARAPGGLPQSMSDLYQRGCLALADEWNPRRRALRGALRLAAAQRLEIAAWVAASTTLTARPHVWLGPAAETPPNAVALEQLAETVPGAAAEVREQLQEVLATALFSSAGPQAVTWAHWSYAEYLTASFLVQRDLPSAQVRALTVREDGGRARVVPRLRAVAAWLATLSPPYLNDVVTADPMATLQGDLLSFTDANRAAVLSALLAAIDIGLPDRFQAYRVPGLRRIRFPGIEAVLRAILADPSRRARVREAAIEVAQVCDLASLGEPLALRALDRNEDVHVREAAARALAHLDAPTARAQLVPLVLDEDLRGNDLDDQVLGCAFQAVWPLHLDTPRALRALRPPKHVGFVGSYAIFLGNLREELGSALSGAALVDALEWVAGLQTGSFDDEERSNGLADLAVAIIERAWQCANEAAVLDALARVVAVQLVDRRVYGLADRLERLPDDPAIRFGVLIRVLERTSWDVPAGIDALTVAPLEWVRQEDLSWLVDKARRSPLGPQLELWCRLLDLLPVTGAWHEQVWTLCDAVPACRERFRSTLGPIALQSEEATRSRELQHSARERRRQQREFQERLGARRKRDEEESGLSDEDLGALADRAGDSEADFVHLQLGLDREWMQADFVGCSAWVRLAHPRQEHVVGCASRFLSLPGPAPQCVPQQLSALEMAGFRAMYTLATHRAPALDCLEEGAWARWAGVCLRYPISSGREEQEIARRLAAFAYRGAPTQLLATLDLILEHESSQPDCPLFVLDRLDAAWDVRLADHVFDWVTAHSLGPRAFESALQALLKQGSLRATEWSLERVALRNGGLDRARVVGIAVSLLTHASGASWPSIQRLLAEDPELAREIFLHFADETRRKPRQLLDQLDEAQLGDLYVWLTRQFRYAEDPRYDGEITPRHHVTELRGATLTALNSRGSQGAVAALEGVRRDLPDEEWLDHVLAQARDRVHEAGWHPVSLTALAQLVRRRDSRIVESADQLLDVVTESLGRLQVDLQGELPAVRDLWNEVRTNVWRPKEEEALSDYVARFLRRDLVERGIVVGREVQIRRGEKTDVRVWATTPGASTAIGLVIEVKGCWNQTLETDMQSQLRDRYLQDGCRCGLYLVGHFQAQAWDAKDWRRDEKWSRRTAGELQQVLDDQVSSLSSPSARLAALVLDGRWR